MAELSIPSPRVDAFLSVMAHNFTSGMAALQKMLDREIPGDEAVAYTVLARHLIAFKSQDVHWRYLTLPRRASMVLSYSMEISAWTKKMNEQSAALPALVSIDLDRMWVPEHDKAVSYIMAEVFRLEKERNSHPRPIRYPEEENAERLGTAARALQELLTTADRLFTPSDGGSYIVMAKENLELICREICSAVVTAYNDPVTAEQKLLTEPPPPLGLDPEY